MFILSYLHISSHTIQSTCTYNVHSYVASTHKLRLMRMKHAVISIAHPSAASGSCNGKANREIFEHKLPGELILIIRLNF